jgi:hypothetical protein
MFTEAAMMSLEFRTTSKLFRGHGNSQKAKIRAAQNRQKSAAFLLMALA